LGSGVIGVRQGSLGKDYHGEINKEIREIRKGGLR